MSDDDAWTATYGDVENLADVLAKVQEIDPSKHLECISGDRESAIRDNSLRAAWATEALVPYVKRTFGASEEEFDTMLGDLFSDLMHLCDAVGVDVNDTLDKARNQYNQEIHGDV